MHLGGNKSYCFMKMPTDFVTYIVDAIKIYMQNANTHLRTVKAQDPPGDLGEFLEKVENCYSETMEMLKDQQVKVKLRNQAINLWNCENCYQQLDMRSNSECPDCVSRVTKMPWTCKCCG